MSESRSEDFAARRATFRKLHESGCFLIPNPWDVGSARYLQGLGFKALATTSAGFAFSLGRPDSASAVPLDVTLAHFAEIAAASDLPVNADFQAGYADTPAGVGENVRRCVETGVAGLSIEDSTGDPRRPLYDVDEAVRRLQAARAAIDASGTGVLLTARAECHLVGTPDPLPDSIRRLRAYAEAGADVLYAPGPRERADIKAIIDSVAPKPVNVLMGWHGGLLLSDLAELGTRRVSVGGALARAAWSGFIQAARLMAEAGRFDGLEGAVTYAELNGFFEADYRKTLE
ncbi:MAG TPA: isocitrate lyase/phosphoenolpyruvate mutase family protein [Vicinamibacteria bacterium]|nr:isocitrate lyase/phosphoenolpyruvate mutase family protein [Vicinamibacteria bacterium]